MRPRCPITSLGGRSSHAATYSPIRSLTETAVAGAVVAAHPEQGWNLHCDGAIVFDDTGELLPDGSAVAPHRAPAERLPTAA
ncbi:DUF5999 family protein [Streptomyces sp. ALI-76-A]|uniref:DUF5999 family protein n=1 Tax=Streptomyces sp. ALI-76-A TaxID=3025736 RepID=UPI00256EF06A|nr:DUF5999 family protein [Streptomyces sp. ALI-76-A]MDL5204347.1 DUF5999 family protein [Streptomyces sp. ALI-76-A]